MTETREIDRSAAIDRVWQMAVCVAISRKATQNKCWWIPRRQEAITKDIKSICDRLEFNKFVSPMDMNDNNNNNANMFES